MGPRSAASTRPSHWPGGSRGYDAAAEPSPAPILTPATAPRLPVAFPRSTPASPTPVETSSTRSPASSSRPTTGCLEHLTAANLIRNRHLARAIGDAGWAELARQLAYKQAWHGGQIMIADRWFPSTRTCSRCGLVKQQIGLAERTFRCDRCGLTIDRDRNAAANLAAWAERQHAQVPDRQAGGRVSNASGGEGAGRRHRDGATGPGERGTDAPALAGAEDTREGWRRTASPRWFDAL